MFVDLRAPEHQLVASQQTIDDLDRLADIMIEPAGAPENSTTKIKTAFTYFGQFLDHDITKQGDATDQMLLALKGNAAPAPTDALFDKIQNARTGKLDLDSLYEAQDPKRSPVARAAAASRRQSQDGAWRLQ